MTRELKFYRANEGARHATMDEVFRNASKRIATDGWNQGDFFGEGGGACALGAVSLAASGAILQKDDYEQALEMFIDTFKELNPNLDGINTIPDINDHPSVTAMQVQMAFEKAAAKIEEAKE